MKHIAILLMLFSTSAGAEWTSADTKRQVIFTGVLALDWSQTRYIAKNPDEFREINPILGDNPTPGRVDGYFVSLALINLGVSYLLPDRYRHVWQNISIGYEACAVTNNINLGVGFYF